MMWLNWSVATINATLQLLDIYRLYDENDDKHQPGKGVDPRTGDRQHIK